MGDVVHIEDLARPRFTPEVMAIQAAMAAMDDGATLDVGALHEAARRETGLDDFGPSDYEERLEVLVAALGDIEDLTPAGRVGFGAQMTHLLKNRLRLTDLLHRHPEIHDLELEPPIIIVGLPRTGTTHLHQLLAADPTLRSLPYWESLEPVPPPAEIGVEPDPRRVRCDATVGFINAAMPLFARMHEMTTDHVHEEIQLLAIDFSTMLFETMGYVPAWEAYYRSHDQSPHYEYLRTILKALQFLRGGRRWVLKSPQHLEQLPVVAEVFPGAPVVVTHRDPVAVTVSMATMGIYTARMHQHPIDPVVSGQRWADRIEVMLGACLSDREVLDPDRSMDLRFDDFMADESGTIEQVYQLAGQPLTGEARAAMDAYRSDHERGRLGSIDYRAADIGLDPDELRERFAAYSARFL